MNHKNHNHKKIGLGTAIALILLFSTLAFTLTYWQVWDEFNNKLVDRSKLDTRLQKYIEVEKYISDSYIGEYDAKELLDGAVDGMLKSLKNGGFFMGADEYDRYIKSLNGEFVGIGALVWKDPKEAGLSVKKVYNASPAHEAGIQAGDVIIGIDGDRVTQTGFEKAEDRLLGEPGESIELIVRKAGGGVESLKIVRKVYNTESVSFLKLDGDIGLIKISDFELSSATQFKEAVNSLLKSGVKGLVIDLRFNSGGRISETANILDFLLPEGKLFALKSMKEDEKIFISDGVFLDLPYVAIVNSYTSGNAEVFAAVLEKNDYADLVGEETAGQSYVQSAIPLKDGSAILLSTGEFLLPDGTAISGKKVMPDYPVSMSEENEASLYGGNLPQTDDNQLQKALTVLNEKIKD